MSEAEIGLIGLGTMGANLALNIAEKGHKVAVWNRTASRMKSFQADAGELADNIVACATPEELVAAIRPPRPVILMVPAGDPVDQQIEALRPLFEKGDIIVDGGNANFHDTERRVKELAASGIQLVGMGVSGGEEGARHGPSIMVGADKGAWLRIENILTDIAAKYEGEPCAAWLGTGGAGHFVKTIHNGIEYADMQMIAEIYGILRDGPGLSAGDIGAIFARWNDGRLNSYLIEITAEVLATPDGDNGVPLVDVIQDKAGQKGTGRWSVIEAAMLGVPATCIEAAVAARGLSALKKEREYASRRYPQTPRPPSATSVADLVAELESALLAGKIAAYAQGFAVMQAASAEHGWELPMATIARIWRAGCIIRSQLLDSIAKAYDAKPKTTNLMVAPAFVDMMTALHPALRITVGRAALQGLPTPALSAALAYFDGYRQPRGTANLIQGQRDFCGAHGFEKIGSRGKKHGEWKTRGDPA
ncbi:MAG: NADP-dependent phosphogluconate dehydrogenase [Rhizobiaceae bacterium]